MFAAAALPLAAAIATPTGVAVPSGAPAEIIELGVDHHDRPTVPVLIGADGPYRFLVDTGAERTVLSSQLADRLGLPRTGRVIIIGIAGRLATDLVEIEKVTLGRRSFYGLTAALVDYAHLAADGIVGLDSLQDQRVLLDFEKGFMAVDSRRALGGDAGFEIVVRARRRSGQLIMTDAIIDGIRTSVVLDTGSQSAIGNLALRRQLARRRATSQTTLVSVTGQEIAADLARVGSLRIGALRLDNVSVAFVDAPPFAALGLMEKPAIILGMSELRAFKRVAIDFETRQVLFDLPADAPLVFE